MCILKRHVCPRGRSNVRPNESPALYRRSVRNRSSRSGKFRNCRGELRPLRSAQLCRIHKTLIYLIILSSSYRTATRVPISVKLGRTVGTVSVRRKIAQLVPQASISMPVGVGILEATKFVFIHLGEKRGKTFRIHQSRASEQPHRASANYPDRGKFACCSTRRRNSAANPTDIALCVTHLCVLSRDRRLGLQYFCALARRPLRLKMSALTVSR